MYKRVVMVAMALGLAVPALAWAASGHGPVKGALYESTNAENGLTFEVSANGRSLSRLSPNFGDPIPCDMPPGDYTLPTHAKISGGRFTLKPRFGTAALTGRFVAKGGVRITFRASGRCHNPNGTFNHYTKHYTVHLTATSEPRGESSRWCLDHAHEKFQNIIEIKTTCAAVYAAMNAGKFTPPTGPPAGFTTPGWSCTLRGFRFTCSKRTASFIFTPSA